MIDTHADTISRIWRNNEGLLENTGHFDLLRAKQAGVSLQFMALFSGQQHHGAALREILMQIDYYYEQIEALKEMVYPVLSYQDILRNRGNGRIGLLLHLEGGEAVGHDLSTLRNLFRLGVRSMGLTWNHRNLLADGALDAGSKGGLSNWGVKVVAEMNRLGMLIDLAHISAAGFYDVLKVSSRPVIVSHANSAKLLPHPRNLTDDQMKTLSTAGGLMGATFVPDFVSDAGTVDDLTAHMMHMIDIMGIDHVAFGSDFDGTNVTVIPDVSAYSFLIQSLMKRGLSDAELQKIKEENCLCLLKNVLA